MYHGWYSRFYQPDPWDGSYDLTDPQSFNRYSYVQNDPVNYVDPSGLYAACIHEAMTKFLAKLTGKYDNDQVELLGRFAGDKPGGADSPEYSATSFKNAIKGFLGRGPSADIHFASEAKLQQEIANFPGYILDNEGYQRAAFVLHSIQDVHGAHQGYGLPFGHGPKSLAARVLGIGKDPDRVIGDAKFLRAANETYQVLLGDRQAILSAGQINDLINAIVTGCGKKADKFTIIRPALTGGGGGGIGGGFGGGGYPWWWYSMWEFLAWIDSIRVASLE